MNGRATTPVDPVRFLILPTTAGPSVTRADRDLRAQPLVRTITQHQPLRTVRSQRIHHTLVLRNNAPLAKLLRRRMKTTSSTTALHALLARPRTSSLSSFHPEVRPQVLIHLRRLINIAVTRTIASGRMAVVMPVHHVRLLGSEPSETMEPTVMELASMA